MKEPIPPEDVQNAIRIAWLAGKAGSPCPTLVWSQSSGHEGAWLVEHQGGLPTTELSPIKFGTEI